MYRANSEPNIGMVDKSANTMQLDINLSIIGQSSLQIGCNFFVELLHDGNNRRQESELKNPLHGLVADSGAITLRNSLKNSSVFSKMSGAKYVCDNWLKHELTSGIGIHLTKENFIT